MTTTTMKGHACPYRPILCQEGFCSECQIYKDYLGYLKTMGRKLWVGSPKNEVCQFCSVSRTTLKEMMAEGGKEELTMVNTILQNCPACAKALGGRGYES